MLQMWNLSKELASSPCLYRTPVTVSLNLSEEENLLLHALRQKEACRPDISVMLGPEAKLKT